MCYLIILFNFIGYLLNIMKLKKREVVYFNNSTQKISLRKYSWFATIKWNLSSIVKRHNIAQ